MKTSLVAGEILLRLPLMMGGIDSTFSLASRMTGYLPERGKGEEGKTKEGDEGGYEGEEEGEDEGHGKKVRHTYAIVHYYKKHNIFSKKYTRDSLIRLASHLSLSPPLSLLSLPLYPLYVHLAVVDVVRVRLEVLPLRICAIPVEQLLRVERLLHTTHRARHQRYEVDVRRGARIVHEGRLDRAHVVRTDRHQRAAAADVEMELVLHKAKRAKRERTGWCTERRE